MNITKSVYTICISFIMAGLAIGSPAALYAATEAVTPAPIAPASPSPAQNHRLPELLEKVIMGQATAPELHEVIAAIILEVEPLLAMTKQTADPALHAALARALDAAKAAHANEQASVQSLQKSLDDLMAVMTPLLAPAHAPYPPRGSGQPAPQATAEPSAPKTEEEQTLDEALKQLRSLDLMLGELALVVENNTVKVSNKRDHLEKIRDLRGIIFRVENSAYTNIDRAGLLTLISLTAKILDTLHDSLKHGFQELPAIDMEQFVTRSSRTDISLEELQDRLDENTETVELVDKAAKSAGLLWYNKVYRVFDKYIVQWGQKHRILHTDFPWLGSRAKMALFAATAGLLVAYISESANKDKLETPLLAHTGYHPRFTDSAKQELDDTYHNPSQKLIDEYNKAVSEGKSTPSELLNRFGRYPIKKRPLINTSWFGLPIGWVDSFVQANNPLLFATLPLFYGHASKEIKSGQEWINKKCHTLANFLKGGAYLNQKTAGIDRIIPKITMQDLSGLNHVKEKLDPYVSYFLNPEKCARSKTTPGQFLLFTGPPRTGKTHSAEALAGSIMQAFKEAGRNPDDFNFFVLQAASIASSSSSINELLKLAEEFAPCIIFIDEIDLLQLQRAGGNSQRLSEFLTGMSGALSDRDLSKPVIMMAATNHPENLDVALRQPGRFQEIRFEYPSYNDRLELLTRRLAPLIPNMQELDLEKIARETEGGSYAALESLVRGGFQNARMKGERLAQHHLEHALDTEVRGIIMQDGYPLSSDERQLIAVHQAGHALATVLLNGNLQLAQVNIRPYLNEIKEEATWDRLYKDKEKAQKKIEHGKTYTFHKDETHGFMSSDEMLKECKVHLAGHIAEKLLFGECGYSYHKEDSAATDKLLEPIITKGRDINQFPDEIKTQYKKQVAALCAQCETEVMTLLAAYKPALIAIAQALDIKQSLSCNEVIEIALSAQQAYAVQQEAAKAGASSTPDASPTQGAEQEKGATETTAVAQTDTPVTPAEVTVASEAA